jgi:hypothetical protein
MLKSLAQITALGAFVIVVGFLGWMLWRSLFGPQEIENYAGQPKSAQTEQQRADEKPRGRHPLFGESKSTEKAVAEYTGWLAVFTALLVLVSAFQIGFLVSANETATKAANAARDAVEATRDATRIDQRAWVSLKNVFTDPKIPEVGKTIRFSVEFYNSGKTPARKLIGNAVVDPVAKGGEPNFSYTGDKQIAAGYMAPNSMSNADLFPAISRSTGKPGPLTQPLFDGITNGDIILYVHGRIDYEDIFGLPHWTTFCWFYLPGNGQFGACAAHNDSDDYHPQN